MIHFVYYQSMNLPNVLVRADNVNCAFFWIIRLELIFISFLFIYIP